MPKMTEIARKLALAAYEEEERAKELAAEAFSTEFDFSEEYEQEGIDFLSRVLVAAGMVC